MHADRIAIGVAIISLALLALLWVEVAYLGNLQPLDASVDKFIGAQPGLAILISKALHYIFSTFAMIGITAAVAFMLWQRAGIRQGMFLAFFMLLNTGISQLVKYIVNRPRPGDALLMLKDAAFPSGHSSTVPVFFCLLCMILLPRVRSAALRAWMIAGTALITLIVGLSRLLLHVHWVTDVLGGFAQALFVLAVAYLVKERFLPGKMKPGKSDARLARA